MTSTMPNFVTDYSGVGDGVTLNDTAFSTVEANNQYTSVYMPDGVFKTSLLQSQLHKYYWGRGKIVTGDVTGGVNWVLPPTSSYADILPTGNTGQGNTGWFAGDQTFTDGGEWKVIGPNARTYSLSQPYYVAQLTPHHAWLDIESGNSGQQAFLPSGATAGSTTITVNGTAPAEWVGKTVGFLATSPFVNGSASVVETKTITAVSGATFTVNSALANSYPSNPGAGLFPSITFSARTLSTHKYIKVNHTGGGDGYGHVVRLKVGYTPKPTETNVNMTACGGQYGGDVNFSTSGVRATGWESQYIDNGNDVGAIAQVDTFYRTNDTCPPGSGRVWLGTLLKSGATRPIDAAYVWAGLSRNGLDFAEGQFQETALLTAATPASGSVITLNSLNGAAAGDPIQIGDGPTYSGTISSINVAAKQVTVTPTLPAGSIAAGTIVKFISGGAALNLAMGQRIVFNSSASSNGRGGDPTGVFPALYGNVQGDIIMETGTDGTSDYWSVRYNGNGHSGATARLRLRPTVMQLNTGFSMAGALNVQGGMTLAGDAGSGTGWPTIFFGTNTSIRFNTTANRFEIVKSGTVVATF